MLFVPFWALAFVAFWAIDTAEAFLAVGMLADLTTVVLGVAFFVVVVLVDFLAVVVSGGISSGIAVNILLEEGVGVVVQSHCPKPFSAYELYSSTSSYATL